MAGMDAWDLALLGGAGYVAITVLIRMMQRQRDAILEDLTEQVQAEREQARLRKKKQRDRKLREQVRQQQQQQRDS